MVGEERSVAWGQELRRVHGRLRAALAQAKDAIEGGEPAHPLTLAPVLAT